MPDPCEFPDPLEALEKELASASSEKVELYNKPVLPGSKSIKRRVGKQVDDVLRLMQEMNVVVSLINDDPSPSFADLKVLISFRKRLNKALGYADAEPKRGDKR